MRKTGLGQEVQDVGTEQGVAQPMGTASSWRDLTCTKKGSQILEDVTLEPRRECVISFRFHQGQGILYAMLMRGDEDSSSVSE